MAEAKIFIKTKVMSRLIDVKVKGSFVLMYCVCGTEAIVAGGRG